MQQSSARNIHKLRPEVSFLVDQLERRVLVRTGYEIVLTVFDAHIGPMEALLPLPPSGIGLFVVDARGFNTLHEEVGESRCHAGGSL